MILNESYFDDIEITDDNIKSSDSIATSHNNEYANIEEYYNAMSSKYSHYMYLGIQANKILTDSDLWNNKIPCMLKRLSYMFDAYGMEYSKPVVTEPPYRVRYLIDDKLENCKFFDFYGYKLLLEEDNLEDDYEWVSVLLFFNPPKTLSYIAACKFVGNIMRTLWKNKLYDTFVDSISVTNLMSSDILFSLFNPYTHDKISRINKKEQLDWKVVTIVGLFFPEKNYNDIFKELIEDKQLLLKLYNCFPDY